MTPTINELGLLHLHPKIYTFYSVRGQGEGFVSVEGRPSVDTWWDAPLKSAGYNLFTSATEGLTGRTSLRVLFSQDKQIPRIRFVRGGFFEGSGAAAHEPRFITVTRAAFPKSPQLPEFFSSAASRFC